MAFKFNKDANYNADHIYALKPLPIFDKVDVYVTQNQSFKVTYPNILNGYAKQSDSRAPHGRITGDPDKNNMAYHNWMNSPMKWFQNQINFAIWCATCGCGVSYNQHLAIADAPFLKSLYLFHVQYQALRILVEMKVPLPDDKSFCWYDNAYDKAAYHRICTEFGVDPNKDFRQKIDHGSDGLGGWCSYFKPGDSYRASHMADGPFFNENDYIQHYVDISNAWSSFVLDNSVGYTRAGVQRLNDSIRIYVWSILGAQSQTRTSILGTGTAFDAQKQYLANVNDAIHREVDLPDIISRYQTVLKYARSKVDFVYGIGLYMAPSDMDLQIGSIKNYNNLIVIATEKQAVGFNGDVNSTPVPPPIQTQEKSIIKPMQPIAKPPALKPQLAAVVKPQVAEPQFELENHENQKTALVVGGIVIGLGLLLFMAR